MTYRSDIDCLRGISVIAVALYHFKFEFFSGGYLGVDIFFVISGYLITSLILKELNEKKFSLTNFYKRRIRRLFPALILVILTTFFLFNEIYLEKEIKQLSSSILSTVLFYANFFFMEAGSYFSPVNEKQPLLHTWSLAIEEQFYLIFPIFLILFFKRINKIFIFTIVVALLSIILSQFGGNLKFNYPYIESEFNFFSIPGFAYYFTFTRIWEILIGCILSLYFFIYKKKSKNLILTITGYLLIIISILFFNENTHHPSIITLLPITGTVLILAFSDSKFNQKGFLKLFNNVIFLKIGLISYSLYLWHQPIYQFFNQIYFVDSKNFFKFLIFLFVIFISYFSYKFVELPFRRKNSFKTLYVYSFYFTCSFLLIFYSLYSSNYKDYSKRYSPLINEISNNSNYYINNNFNCGSSAENYLSPNDACILGKNETVELAFIGDSHLDIISIELNKILSSKNTSALQFSYAGCFPALNLNMLSDKRYNCNHYFDEVLDKIKSSPDLKKLIIFSRWSFNLTGERFNNGEGGIEIGENIYFAPINNFIKFNKEKREELILTQIEFFIEELSKFNQKIYIVMPTPEMGWEIPNNLARILYFKKELKKETLSISRDIFIDRNKKIINFFKKLKKKYDLVLIYPDDIFCDKIRCYAHKKNNPLFFDDDHLSELGAKLISQKILNAINK